MLYFVTGASGFIGKRFVRKILAREDAQVCVLLRDASVEAVARLREFCGDGAERIVAVQGDITIAKLGVAAKDAKAEGQDRSFRPSRRHLRSHGRCR